MISVADKKPTLALDKKVNTSPTDTYTTNASPRAVHHKKSAEELRTTIKALDAERTELVRKTIENTRPGRPFDSSVIREINKIETKKNRLIIALFALLMKNPGDVQAIVHQIIEL